MNSPRKKARRVIRPLTPDETKRVADARQDVEVERDAIRREGRIAKQAWLAMRREVGQAVTELRGERERLGMSLADVEERSGLRRSVLSRLENDRTANPTMLTLQRYAAALGLTMHARVAGDVE
jgi:ribosome-binding protein aMBF1 (putative translation factor)